MSLSTISSLDFAGKHITIYLDTLTLIAGVIGGFLIIVVFLSLRTFRQSPCAFYLTIMSIVNIGQMLRGLLSRIIMTTGFDIDWSRTSLFFCKFRYYCFQVCALTSMTCTCLATMEQYQISSPSDDNMDHDLDSSQYSLPDLLRSRRIEYYSQSHMHKYQ